MTSVACEVRITLAEFAAELLEKEELKMLRYPEPIDITPPELETELLTKSD